MKQTNAPFLLFEDKESRRMTGQELYLALVIVGFVTFAVVLFGVSTWLRMK